MAPIDEPTLNRLLAFGVEKGASDIHFEVGGPPRYRIKGELLKAKFDNLTPESTLAIASLLAKDRHVELTGMFPEIDTSYSITGVSRFRVSCFRQRGSIGLVLRVVPYQVPNLTSLGLPAVLKDIAGTRRGLVLITGATGMGKSTTIAALLDSINEARQVHIITIEDPIEFLFESKKGLVIQREIGTDTNSYSDAMLAALRQDPDVIMLGELRDDKTAATCLKAAETGHFVVSTMHTPDVVSTVNRLSGFFEDTPANLGRIADALQAVVSLRLVRKADNSGLVPLVEVMRVTTTIQERIRDRTRHNDILPLVEKGQEMYGMQTFDQHIVQLLKANVINMETAKRAASKPDELERALLVDSAG